ncbi:hypothetical protein ACIBSW_18495 [Actinoplanes sp. NPDC049668]|uniref:hypothetical protein n=1 Tax=unclassified Actinoplanes TaxID=2626549 RepID=UPI0033A0C6CF
MPLAATAHAAPDRPVTVSDMSVTLVGDRPAIASMTVRNNGDAPVQGFSLRLRQLTFPITVDGDVVNCYNARDDRPPALPFTCLFPVTLAAGTEYRVELPVRGSEGDWPGESVYEDFHVDSWSDAATGKWRELAKNAGRTLELAPPAAPMPAASFEDRGEPIGYGTGFLRATQRPSRSPDLAAVAERVTARPGETVRPGAGVHNAGTVALRPHVNNEFDSHPPLKPSFKITVPDGVTVVEVADDCDRDPDSFEPTGDPFGDKKEFICYGIPWHTSPLKPGDRYVPGFALRLDRDVRDAVGTVTVVIDGDDNPANNTAEYVINPTSPATTAPATTAPTTAGGGAGEGGLPITGPSATGVLTAGLTILLTGVALLVATRRRAARAGS